MEEMRYQLDYLQAMNKKLDADRRIYQNIVNTSQTGLLYYSFEDNSLSVFGNYNKFFPDVNIQSLRDLYDYLDSQEVLEIEEIKKFLYCERYELNQYEIDMPLGDIWCHASCLNIYDNADSVHAKIFRFTDNTTLYRQNEELRDAVYLDKTTGMFNREYFVRNLIEWVGRAEKENKTIAVANLDIDGFRKINDGIGIVVGDELIQMVGNTIKSCCDNKDIICSRFNGDQFYIAVYDPIGRKNIGYIYEIIKEKLENPVKINGYELHVSVSVGVASYPEGGDSALEIINSAEIVMFRAKKQGKGCIAYFEKSIVETFRKNIVLEDTLKRAQKNKEFILFYQPQYDGVTGKLRGLEALVRLPKKGGGMISPADFIPLAESTKMIVPIGEQVMEMAISAMANWKRLYHSPFIMCINVSAIQFKNEYFQSRIQGLISKYHLNPEDIEIELTESVLSEDFDGMIRKMMALKSFGIRISIDDFGTGYSSLSYLNKLPAETIKIDKTFVDHMLTEENDRIIISSILSLTKQLGYEVVAEGVESQEQMDSLVDMGCDVIQGYLLGKPMPDDSIEHLLKELSEKSGFATVSNLMDI